MMNEDLGKLDELLQSTLHEAEQFLQDLPGRAVAQLVPEINQTPLPVHGLGGEQALALLKQKYIPCFSSSAGPKYFAFVTGGATPASLMGDWLTSVFDQNASDAAESGSRQLCLDACQMLRDLLQLPEDFSATIVTGATTSSLVGLATARQWLGRERGINVGVEGLCALGPVKVLSATAHSSIHKVLSILGMGRSALEGVATLEGREAVDVDALDARLAAIAEAGQGPAIVVANAGTVNTCDFDDLQAIKALRQKHRFWLHVDAAFGGVAAASANYRPLLAGIEAADSITIDAHKWLNVPYDSALIFTRHLALQGEVFNSFAAYLPSLVQADTFIHLTPENSQRLRALPLWMSLVAYGKQGYEEIVDRCCEVAALAGQCMEADPRFELLAPVKLNGLCFTLRDVNGLRRDEAFIRRYLLALQKSGSTFLTPTQYKGTAAIRVSISNWRTTIEDMKQVWDAMQEILLAVEQAS